MGHSMGGAEVLLLSLLQAQSEPLPHVSGILLESPYIALHPSSQPGAVTVLAGKLASRILPKHQSVQKLASDHLCRDHKVCTDWEADDLCHDTGTLEGLAGMLQRAADLTSFANGRIVQGIGPKTALGTDPKASDSVPIWIGHGSEDKVTNHLSSQAIYRKLDVKDKTIKLYEGAYHKLHAEPDGVAEEFVKDVANWILARTSVESRQGDANDPRPKL